MKKKLGISSLGGRISFVRGEMGQEDFAEEMGVNRMTLARYEHGERTPDATFLNLLVTKYSVDANWLLLGVGEPPKPELTPREAALLDNYRASDEGDKQILERTGASFAKSGVEDKSHDDLKKVVWPAGEKKSVERNLK